jgi:hypothetical protein
VPAAFQQQHDKATLPGGTLLQSRLGHFRARTTQYLQRCTLVTVSVTSSSVSPLDTVHHRPIADPKSQWFSQCTAASTSRPCPTKGNTVGIPGQLAERHVTVRLCDVYGADLFARYV